MHKFYTVASVLFILTGIAGADAGQTGWYLGGGDQGPVVGWPLPYFYQSSDICFWQSEWMGSCGPRTLRLSLAERTQIALTNEHPISVYASDLDSDGDQDVIALFGFLGGTQQVLWWRNIDGLGGLWEEQIIDTQFIVGRSVVSSDIDGNGTNDVIAASEQERVCWWSNTDGTGNLWEEHLVCNEGNLVECADMDGDGDTDLAISSWSFDTFFWYENTDGIGENWEEHEIASSIKGAQCGNPCDMNSDGYMDFIGMELFANTLYWWENKDGTGTTWTEHVISTSIVEPRSMHAGDIDGDGDLDVTAVSNVNDDVVWFRNDDGLGGAWTEILVTHMTIPLYRNLYDVHTSDLDADGDIDICSLVHCAGGWVFWCENIDGAGEIWAVHVFDPFVHSPFSVHPADINGDGKNDLITCLAGGTGSSGGDITWWDLNEDGYSPEGYLESSILDTDIASPDYHTLSFEYEVPSGTMLSLQIRASDDHTNMGGWSEPLYTFPIGIDDSLDGDRYFQYRVNMETTDPLLTPSLALLELTWDILGIEEGDMENVGILSVFSNPMVSGLASVVITCDNPVTMELSVFDLSGRRVFSVPEKQYEAGISTVPIQDIPSGIYMCLVTGEDFNESIRFVLTE